MYGRYAELYTDFGFKKVLGTETNKELLLDLLNELIDNMEYIDDLNYKSTEHLGKLKVDRKVVFDIYCETKRGEKVVVEMQREPQRHFKDRGIYYSSVLIQGQAKKKKGEKWKYNLKPVYVIAILNFVLDAVPPVEGKGYYRNEVTLMNDVCRRVYSDKLTYINIEMPNFNKTESELETNLDKWLYALKNMPELDRQPEKLSGPIFDRLFREAEIANFTEDELWDYEQSLKACWDAYSTLETHLEMGVEKGVKIGRKEGIEIGREEGIEIGVKKEIKKGRKKGIKKGRKEGIEIGVEKGRKEGIEEGIEIGVEEGRKEGIEEGIEIGVEKGIEIGVEKGREEVIESCIRNGMPIEQIEIFFGLSRDKILKIIESGKPLSN
jgi:predicted transposase/invertase (TIGR01784 family)